MSLLKLQHDQVLDHNGEPYSGAYLYVMQANSTTLADSYTDETYSTKHTNPVIADSRGAFPPIHVKPGNYKIVLGDSDYLVITTEDNLVFTDPDSDLQSQITANAQDIDALELNQPSTGDVIFTIRATPPTGWVLCDGDTIGNASSNAGNRANNDTEDLFALLWNNVQSYVAIFDSLGVETTYGASAEADYAANKAIQLPLTPGRSIIGAGQGYQLTNRPLGSIAGAETHTLTENEMPSHSHQISASTGGTVFVTGGTGFAQGGTDQGDTDAKGGGAAHNIMQPSIAFNLICKL